MVFTARGGWMDGWMGPSGWVVRYVLVWGWAGCVWVFKYIWVLGSND